MSTPLFVGSAFVAKYPKGGGNFWVPLQYLRGFRDLGVETYWLEVLEGTGRPDVDALFIATFQQRVAELGHAGHTVLLYYPRTIRVDAEDVQVFGMAREAAFARMRDGALLSLVGLAPAVRQRFARRVLFDLDPSIDVDERRARQDFANHLTLHPDPASVDNPDRRQTQPVRFL